MVFAGRWDSWIPAGHCVLRCHDAVDAGCAQMDSPSAKNDAEKFHDYLAQTNDEVVSKELSFAVDAGGWSGSVSCLNRGRDRWAVATLTLDSDGLPVP
jgi:hypothetical protein